MRVQPSKSAQINKDILESLNRPVATLDREGRSQGQRAERERAQMDAAMRTPAGRAQQPRELQVELPWSPSP